MRTQRRGFTFVELLIVTSIIAVLAAILFPVFAQAREKGRNTACQHNLRQISIALQLYAHDHYGHFPPRDNDFAPLFPYLREEDVFRCPTAEALPHSVEQSTEALTPDRPSHDLDTAHGNISNLKDGKETTVFGPIPLGLIAYAYRGGYTHDDLPNRILAADTLPYHHGGGNLLLLNNQVKWFKKGYVFSSLDGPGLTWLGATEGSSSERW